MQRDVPLYSTSVKVYVPMSDATNPNVPANVNPNLPKYLQNRELPPAEHRVAWGMSSFSKPPRVFIVQGLSKPPLKPPYVDADIVLMGGGFNKKIGDQQTPYTCSPIGFFVDYLALNPNGRAPYIRERSFDPLGDIARKAELFLSEQFPGGEPNERIKFVKNLNFIFIIHDPEIGEIPVHHSFMKGHFKTGQNLIGMIENRRESSDIPFCHRYRVVSKYIPGKNQSTFPTCDFTNDPVPYVTDEQYVRFEKLADEFDKIKRAGKIDTEIDNLNAEGDGEDAANEKKF